MMPILKITQGSDEWHAIRASHFTASEAPAMMGASKYMTRNDLLRQKATGITPDADSGKQCLFDKGHAAEAAARPIIEDQIGEILCPVTASVEVDGLPLLASLDGLTMDEKTVWECKLYNAGLEQQILNERIDPHYYWQLEQQLLVSGAERVIFTTSDGTPANTISATYRSQPERRAALIAGWMLFAEDLKNYQHVEVTPAAVAAPISELPALMVEISGSVTASNLAQWKEIVTERIAGIKTDLQTDQDFADADSMVKFLDDGEKRIDLVKSQAQANASDIDRVFRALDEIKASMRAKRLELDKLVSKRKESIKIEIMQGGKDKLAEHIATLNKSLGKPYMPVVAADWATAIKSKRTVASLQNAVDTLLAQKMIEATAMANTIDINLRVMRELCDPVLFPDIAAVCTKQPEDFAALVAMRVGQEEKRLEAEREEIRAEESAKLIRQQQEADAAKARAEAETKQREVDEYQKKFEAERTAGLWIEAMQSAVAESGKIKEHAAKLNDAKANAAWQQARDEVGAMLDDLSVAELSMIRVVIAKTKQERQREAAKRLRNMTEADFVEAHG